MQPSQTQWLSVWRLTCLQFMLSDLQAMLPAGLPYVEPCFANIEPLQWQPPPPVLSPTSTRSVPTVEPHQPSSQAVASAAVMYGAEDDSAQAAVSPACYT